MIGPAHRTSDRRQQSQGNKRVDQIFKLLGGETCLFLLCIVQCSVTAQPTYSDDKNSKMNQDSILFYKFFWLRLGRVLFHLEFHVNICHIRRHGETHLQHMERWKDVFTETAWTLQFPEGAKTSYLRAVRDKLQQEYFLLNVIFWSGNKV